MQILEKHLDDLKVWPFIEAHKIIDRYGGISNFDASLKKNIEAFLVNQL